MPTDYEKMYTDLALKIAQVRRAQKEFFGNRTAECKKLEIELDRMLLSNQNIINNNNNKQQELF